MYLVKIAVKKSDIEGKGVFALEDIKKGSITWKFDPLSDKSLAPREFEALDAKTRETLLRVAYLSPTSHRWVYPSQNDSASFTNHSKKNNQSVIFDESISEEPFFQANRDIKMGEELTVDYGEFDARPKNLLEEWV
jgi:hypothetical protein